MFRNILVPISRRFNSRPAWLPARVQLKTIVWRQYHFRANYAVTSTFDRRRWSGGGGWNYGGRNSGWSGSRLRAFLVGISGMLGGGSLRIFGFFEQDEESIQESIILSMKKAILAIQREDLDLAEKHLSQAFRTSKKHGLEDAMTQIIDMQANLAFAKDELERAENLFKLVVQRLIGQGKMVLTDNSIVEISIKLSEIYRKMGRMVEAATGLTYCIEIQRHKILKQGMEDENTLLLAGWALDNLSNIYLSEGNSTTDDGQMDRIQIIRAKDMAQEAYKYVVMAAGPEARQAVTTRNNVATAHALLGEYETALSILRELEVITRENHPDLYPDIVISIGNVHLEKAEFDEAVQVCTEAKSIASKFKDMSAFERAEKCILKCIQLQKSQEKAQAG